MATSKPIDFAAYRASRLASRGPRLRDVPLVLSAHPGAVGLVIGNNPYTFSPAQARDIGNAFVRFADVADQAGRQR